jgi:glycosyltransferase involved in cell wall biosynthesis
MVTVSGVEDKQAALEEDARKEVRSRRPGRRILVLTNMYPDPPERPVLGIFVKEQVESLRQLGLDVDVLFVDGPGNKLNYALGFLRLWARLLRRKYDLIHAHYVFSAAIALAQPRVPVVTTFHSGEVLLGSFQRILSRQVSKRVRLNIAVSEEVRAKLKGNTCVIPCGVDTTRFFPTDKDEARKRLGLPRDKRLVLFAAAMRPEKRFELVKASCALLKERMPDSELVVLTNQPPGLVPVFMNACDVLVLASQKEGSPQVVKEALACNLPVVSTNVGDIQDLIGDVPGCQIAEPNATDIADKLHHVLAAGKRIDARRKAQNLSLRKIAERIGEKYEEVLTSRAGS